MIKCRLCEKDSKESNSKTCYSCLNLSSKRFWSFVKSYESVRVEVSRHTKCFNHT